MSTAQAALRSTFSVTDPSIKCSKPLVPCVPITIRSAGSAAARSRMQLAGWPTSMSTVTLTPVAVAASKHEAT